MPQLDKYIFFNHVISLTIFFGLIYIFVRQAIVPELSTLLKFRRKKLTSMSDQLIEYEKNLNFSKSVFEKKGKNFINKISDNIDGSIMSYNITAAEQLDKIYDKNYSVLKNVDEVSDLIYDNKEELIRVNSLF
jgi:hypothetical protein